MNMTNRVEFPYMVLLISGGHCLLAIARDIDDFLVIGKGLDDAPGDAFDKVCYVIGYCLGVILDVLMCIIYILYIILIII